MSSLKSGRSALIEGHWHINHYGGWDRMRWWSPADLCVFVYDRFQSRREFGKTIR